LMGMHDGYTPAVNTCYPPHVLHVISHEMYPHRSFDVPQRWYNVKAQGREYTGRAVQAVVFLHSRAVNDNACGRGLQRGVERGSRKGKECGVRKELEGRRTCQKWKCFFIVSRLYSRSWASSCDMTSAVLKLRRIRA